VDMIEFFGVDSSTAQLERIELQYTSGNLSHLKIIVMFLVRTANISGRLPSLR
jgi:hypothetical protein